MKCGPHSMERHNRQYQVSAVLRAAWQTVCLNFQLATYKRLSAVESIRVFVRLQPLVQISGNGSYATSENDL